jgi:hypothetical protein
MKQDVKDRLCNDFKVSPETCNEYEKLYDDIIEKKIRKKYLSHLVSTIEDLINAEIKKNSIEAAAKSLPDAIKNARPFSILLVPVETNGKARVYDCNTGAVIRYNPLCDDKDLRIIIAHELGHVVNFRLSDPKDKDSQNTANVFTFFAINGKNNFYKHNAREYVYPEEFSIISAISAVCPITSYNQH